MLKVEKLNKKYGEINALDDINIDIDAGITGILAPNGAGKTTLLKILTTALKPDSGSVKWNGKEIFDKQFQEDYLSGVAYVPQSMGYYADWSGLDFIRYVSYLRGIDKCGLDEKIKRELDFFDIGDAAKRKMKTYSVGMVKKISLAISFLKECDLYILDEPTAGLDPIECAKLRKRLSETGRKSTVILSTHVISDVESIASTIVMIKSGKIIENKPISELKNNGNSIEQIFLSHYDV